MATDARRLYQRFTKAKDRKMSNWYNHMRECYDYAIPQRETFDQQQPGQKKNTKVYDSTAVMAVPIYANRIQQAVMPSGQHWAKLTAGSNIDDEQRIDFMGKNMTVEEALEEITDIAFEYIDRSNFANRLHESLIDLAVSTAAMTCDYDPDKDELIFDSVPLSHVYLEAGPRGSVDAVWRYHEMKARNILPTWPEAKLPQGLLDVVESSPDKEICIVEGMLFDYKTGEHTLYVLTEDDKGLIYEENFGESSPWVTARTTVIPGEVYGRGPLMRVLPDIKTLNAMAENSLKSAALAVAGVWTATDDGVFNPYTVRIAPGVIIPVSSNANENPTLRSLDMGGNIQFHELEYNRRVDNVNRALFAKPIGDIQDPTKTATEISMRMQMDLQDAGAEFGRLQNELAGNIFKRVIFLLGREGIIPPLTVDGKNIDIKFTSPISQQNEIDEAQTLIRAMQSVMSLGIPPEMVMADLRIEDMPSYILDNMGASAEFKRDEAQKQQMGEMAGQAVGQQLAGQ